ncbi:hypothetical protein CAL7716_053350 [Calothrix sp. PCC 7716]|nr:hypothetical protein CAL7716_053350 [Calothrix sp. PCC 7716]
MKDTYMATRFFLCNLKVYDGIKDDIIVAQSLFAKNQQYTEHWTCGNVVNIAVGDEAYFVRVGDKIRGIFASGEIIEPPTDGVITFQWNAVVDFNKPLLVSELLQRQDFEGANFFIRGSGYRFADEYAEVLGVAWRQYVIQHGSFLNSLFKN